MLIGRLPTLAEVEREHIVRVLDTTHWSKKAAAVVLGIARGTLYRKIAAYRIVPPTIAAEGEVTDARRRFE